MASKAAIRKTIDDLAEELGIETKGGLFRAKRAEGVSDGVDVALRMGSSADIVDYSDAPSTVSTWSEHHVGPSKIGAIKGQRSYRVVAKTRHTPIGLDMRIIPTATPVEQRSGERLVTTGDSVFDGGLMVFANDDPAARRFLNATMRSTIVAFFESGASAIIADDEIKVMADGSARVLAPQIRNAIQMSGALSERCSEL